MVNYYNFKSRIVIDESPFVKDAKTVQVSADWHQYKKRLV